MEAARTGVPEDVDWLGGTSSGPRMARLGAAATSSGARVDGDMGGLGTSPKPGHDLHPLSIPTLLERQNLLKSGKTKSNVAISILDLVNAKIRINSAV